MAREARPGRGPRQSLFARRRAGRSRSPRACGRARSTSSSARSTSSRRASRCARRSSAGVPGSMIFWGPPGTGKTTLARLIAPHTDRVFVPFSAVTEGVPRVREIVGRGARRGSTRGGAQTILFVDEIHRFNKAQQDASCRRRGRHDHADRRDDGESELRDQRRAALARARVRAPAALAERRRGARSRARWRRGARARAAASSTVDDGRARR